jgi:hypothetical protein
MINDIYNLTRFILNKESRGYITPLQFNAFAKQAQQEIVDDYFNDYSKESMSRIARASDKQLSRRTREAMDTFISQPIDLTSNYNSTTQVFNEPSDVYYTINLTYNGNEIELLDRDKMSYHLQDDFSGNSVFYPTYVKYAKSYKVFPLTITSGVKLTYFRNPKDPNWTYTVVNDNPVFNSSLPGYQDLEIGFDDKFKIIIKILKYAGLNIREADIVQASMAYETQEKQMQNQ